MKKVTLVIPCHNEQNGIRKVLTGLPLTRLRKFGFRTEVLVINNCSTDKTAEVARKHGAYVMEETKKGKGNAMRSGFKAVSKDTKYVVMMDGDNTYKGKELLRMIEPLDSNFCDVVIGSRLGGRMKQGSLTAHHRLANWLYTFLVRVFYQANVTDVLSGYFAWKKPALDRLVPFLESDGFAIEMEMITKMRKLGININSVPITYDQRIGESKISSYRDGARILHMLFKNVFWSEKRNSGARIFMPLYNKLRGFRFSENE